MRYIIILLILTGIFVYGNKQCTGFMFDGVEGAGPVRTETRSLPAFQGVKVGISGEAEIYTSNETRVEIQAQDNLMSIIKTEVNDGVLKIYFDKNVWTSSNLKIKIYAPSYDQLVISGSCNMIVRDSLSGSEMDIDISGSGNLDAPNMRYEQLRCDISGSGNMNVAGRVASLDASVSGSGNIEAEMLQAVDGKISVSGSGNIRCDVSGNLDARVSGAGEIRYKNDPQSVSTKVSGSGFIGKL